MGLAMAIPSDIGHRRVDTGGSGFDRLTPAETELLCLMVTGDGDISNKSLARRTFRDMRTIQSHLSNIFRKVRDEGIYDRTSLLLSYARYRGWLNVEPQPQESTARKVQ